MTTTATPLLEVEGLVMPFHVGSQFMGGGGLVRAVDGMELVEVKPLLEEAADGDRVACHLVHGGRESTQLLDLAGEPA